MAHRYLARFAAAALAVVAATPAFAAPKPPVSSGATCSSANAPVLSNVVVSNGDAAWGHLVGSRSVPNNGLTGCDAYVSGFQIDWDVTYDPSTSLYKYLYTFSGYAGGGAGLSHAIVQLSANCANDATCVQDVRAGDATNASAANGDYEVATFVDGGSNPGLPGALYGLKINTPSGLGNAGSGYFVSFLSSRAPVWGDFYGKAGQGYVYNDNLGQASGDLMGYIVRADGVSVPPPTTATPEPASVALVATGLLAMGAAARRRRSRA